MKKATNLFCITMSIIVSFQLLMALIYDYYVCTFQNDPKGFLAFFDNIELMIKVTVCITFVVVPLLSVAMKLFVRRQRQNGTEDDTIYEKQAKKVDKVLGFLWILTFVCWIILFILMEDVVEGQLGVRHGSNEYMAIDYPGSVLSFLPCLGAIISRAILLGFQKETPRHKLQM